MLGMTGYSFKEINNSEIYIKTEVKSVNNRFLEININVPYYLNSLETNIRNLIKEKIRRYFRD